MTTDRLCVVFDVDDTLYLESDYVRSGYSAVGAWIERAYGLSAFGDRCWVAFRSGLRGTIFDHVLASYDLHGVDEDVVPALVERYRRHVPSIALLPDADAALARLSSGSYVAVLSDGPLESQRAKVRALGLIGRADQIVLTEELGPGRGKPDPAGFRLIQERSGIPSERCAYIADNPMKDFRAPAELGWRTVRIRRPQALHRDLPSGPDVHGEVTTLDALEDVLAGAIHTSVSP